MSYRLIGALMLLAVSSSISFAAELTNLPAPNTKSNVSLEQSIYYRRSIREFTEQNLSLNQLSQILWAAQGITDQEFGFRAAPSAGALYPLSIYVAKSDGLFRYIPDGHKLLKLSDEDKRASLLRASLGQNSIRSAPVSIIIAANFAITQAKYGARAFRYVCMETGHATENIHLQATALGLASTAIGAFWDDVVKKNLGLPDNQEPLYIIPIGYAQL
ncbi:MAG: SagB/ThcOx family dehydrogenase [bacterium]